MAYSTSKEYFKCLGSSPTNTELVRVFFQECVLHSAAQPAAALWDGSTSREYFHPSVKCCDTRGGAAAGKALHDPSSVESRHHHKYSQADRIVFLLTPHCYSQILISF